MKYLLFVVIFLAILSSGCTYREVFITDFSELETLKIDKKDIRQVDTLKNVDGQVYRIIYK